MAARPATAAQKAQRELEDLQLVLRARNGDGGALDVLIRRYNGFVRLKASSYFLAGGDSEDLIQEGLIGLYKAVRDFPQLGLGPNGTEGPSARTDDRDRLVPERVRRHRAGNPVERVLQRARDGRVVFGCRE